MRKRSHVIPTAIREYLTRVERLSKEERESEILRKNRGKLARQAAALLTHFVANLPAEKLHELYRALYYAAISVAPSHSLFALKAPGKESRFLNNESTVAFVGLSYMHD